MYRVLYRKWRPQVFSDVVGQPHITGTLSAEVRENRLAHAYLFTGSRGTGKTSCAKILSKAVNCLHPVNGNPCNECEICRGIDHGTILDVTEMDAASNRGIDDMRLLRDETGFTPSHAKYRVYIIDEVHMLTPEASNALLKTLEEPPEHIIFILATTEVNKILPTILSRCQRFDFRRIEPKIIAERLFYVAGQENVRLDEDAAMLIARIADGGMRDALSLLDACISVNDHVTTEVVFDCAGLMGREHVYSLIGAVAKYDTAAALTILDELHSASCDTERLLNELTDQFRNFLIIKTVKEPQNLIVCTGEELSRIKKMSDAFTKEQILFSLNVLTAAAQSVKRSQNRRIEAEMALIRLCSPETDTDVSALAARIVKLEKEISELRSGREAFPPARGKPPASDFSGFGKEAPVQDFSGLFDAEEEDDAPIDLNAEPEMRNAESDEGPVFENEDRFPPAENSKEDMPFRAPDESQGDPDFDVDAFLAQYSGKTAEELQKQEEENAKSGENFLDFKTWAKIILEAERSFVPLVGKLTDSKAYISGDRLLIRPIAPFIKKTTPASLLTTYVEPVVAKHLGKHYTVIFE